MEATKQVVIHNLSRQGFKPITAQYCDSFLCRLRGLTFRRQIPDRWGLLLAQKRESRLDASIHMLGVWTNLTVVWLNSEAEVVDVRLARKWRLAYIPKQPACYILELAPKHIDDFAVGDRINIEST